MIIVLLDSFIFSKTDIISSVVLLSSAPVGSSASITDGLLTIARAIAARCFCPHDSLLQCLSALLFRPVQALFVLFFFYLWACFLQNQEGALPSFTGQVTEGVLFGTGIRAFLYPFDRMGGYDEKGGAVYPDTASSLANLTGRSGRSSALPYPPCE